MNPAILLLLVAGVLIIGMGVFSLVRERAAGGVSERLDRYSDVGAGTKEAKAAAGAGPRPSPIADRLNKVMERRGVGGKTATDLAQADLKMTPAEWLALRLIAIVGAGTLGFVIFHQSLIFVAISCVIGFFLPGIYLNMRKGQRRTKFNNQLSDVINLWVNALRSGYSVMQSLDAMARELPAPASIEFSRVVQEMRLGIPMEVAMANLLRRVPSEDLDLVITAVNVQREVGGNLAEILEVIGHTIRERVRIKGEIEVLTAQQMYGGYVIAFIPVILLLVLYAINPKYVGRMVEPNPQQPCGWAMLAVGGFLILIGFLAIRRIVRIEV
jgi:tight adherence protein B